MNSDPLLVGDASLPLDPWEPGGREVELELFRERDLREDWWPYLRAWRWFGVPPSPTPDSPISLRVGGSAPPRPISELRAAAERGVGFDLTVASGFDLESLAELIAECTYLSVSSAGPIRGWEVLGRAQRLIQLSIDASTRPPHLEFGLANLTVLDAPGALVGLAGRSPVLAKVDLDVKGVRVDDAVEFCGPVQSLALRRADLFVTFPRFAQPTLLHGLHISGADRVDFRDLLPSVELEWVQVMGVKSMAGLGRLQAMGTLRRLQIERVRQVEDPGTLRSFAIKELSVRNSDPMLPELG